MSPLTPGSANPMAGFNWGYDGLVQGFEFTYGYRGRPSTAVIRLLVSQTESPDTWCDVVFRLTEVKEFRVQEGAATCQVLSDGVRLSWEGPFVVLNLDPGPNGLKDPNPHSESSCYFVAETAEWEARPHPPTTERATSCE